MRDITVASVQFQHQPGNKTANLAIMEKFVLQAAEQKVEILAFPECCVPGYWHLRDFDREQLLPLAEKIPAGPTFEKQIEWSKANQMTIGTGLIELAEDGRLYNSYLLTMPDGTWVVHRKLHCFINKNMDSGDSFTVTNTPHDCKVGVLICYDNNLVENARATALAGAEILIAPHQTGGCDSRSPFAMGLIDPMLWKNREQNPAAIEEEFRGDKGRGWLMRWLPARAHDNGMFLIFSNGVGEDDGEVRTGNAMILDPYGRVISETGKAADQMVVAHLDASLRDRCTGSRWIKARRPDLYRPLIEHTGNEVDARTARFK